MLFVFQFYLCVYMALILLTLLVTAVPKQCPFKVQLQPPVPTPALQTGGRFTHVLTFCLAACYTKASAEVVLATVNT